MWLRNMLDFYYSFKVVAVCTLCVEISPLLRINADKLHQEFFELYGNDVNTSGVWEPIRSLASNMDLLMNISLQAHLGSWMTSNNSNWVETVRKAFFVTQTLGATERKYKNISIDLIKYKVMRCKDGVRVKGPKSYFYLTKGMRPDCVYYCWMRGLDTGLFFLDYHVCDIVMPEIPKIVQVR